MIKKSVIPAEIDQRRITIFLALAFLIAWLTSLVVYLTGGLANSPVIFPGGRTLAVVLLAIPYLWAPAIAAILTRLITGEGLNNLGLRLNFRKGWRLWMAAWFLPGLLTLFGGAVFFLFFPQYFDGAFSQINPANFNIPVLSGLAPWAAAIFEIVVEMLLSPIINGLSTFGEEFGWRGYLLPKLLPLGWRKAVLLMGVIWGVWHWPVLLMGFAYGVQYPYYPWLGMLLYIWITLCLGIFLAWLTVQGRSIWPAVIAHAGANGVALATVVATRNNPNVLVGPLPVSLIGSIGFALLAAALFVKKVEIPVDDSQKKTRKMVRKKRN